MFLPATITLKQGDSGDYVTELQRRLAVVKCFSDDQVNGIYDAVTFSAVLMFQSRESIRADGIAGPRTIRRLNCVISGEPDTSEPEDTTPIPPVEVAAEATPLPEIAPTPPPTQTPAPEGLPPAHYPTTETLAPASPSHHPLPAVETPRPLPMAEPHPTMSPPPAPLQSAPAPVASIATSAPLPPMPESALTNPAASIPSPAAAPRTSPAELDQAPPPERKGLVARAMEYASASIQKLGAYFEAKLPPDVHAEVKAIGAVMARNGMKESAIPMDPAQEKAERQELVGGKSAAQQRA